MTAWSASESRRTRAVVGETTLKNHGTVAVRNSKTVAAKIAANPHCPQRTTAVDGLQMPHVLGKFLPENRPVRDALTQFVGIGDHTAYRICARLQFHETLKMGEMSERQLNALSHEVGDLKLENDLLRQVRDNIARLRRIGSYRGKRHSAGLPVRGQNTRNNAMTARKLNKVDRNYHTARVAYGPLNWYGGLILGRRWRCRRLHLDGLGRLDGFGVFLEYCGCNIIPPFIIAPLIVPRSSTMFIRTHGNVARY
jgi:small subunit ribosomal protein S13